MYILKKEDIKKLLNLWSSDFEVYAPLKVQGEVMLLPYEECRLALDYTNFTSPVKEHFFRQKEKIFSFENVDGEVSISTSEENTGKKVIFGVRPCDLYGISYMDSFFLKGYRDELYAKNRRAAFIVAINCTKPGANCFCSSMEVGPFARSGYDILLTPIDDLFLVECNSLNGEKLIKLGEQLFNKADSDYSVLKNILLESAKKRFKTVIDSKDIHGLLKENFDNPIWKDVALECSGCTGCTNVCPTCTCFNIVEEKTDSNCGRRVRYWDSCQSDSFTRNAGEHNPRSSVSRARYRIYDKFKYIEEKFNFKGCTGCGRCISVCPSDINPVKILNKLSSQDESTIGSRVIKDEPVREAALTSSESCVNHHKESCESVYLPQTAVITEIIQETRNIKRFKLQYEDGQLQESFKFDGQFFEITVFGVGEIAISIPFSPSQKSYFDFCIKKAGKVTNAIHQMKVGDKVGLRGPFGKGFPYEAFKGKDVIIVGSGVGLAPVRTMIVRILENRQEFGRVVVIASAISYEDLVYKDDLIRWADIEGVKVLYALSNATDKVEAHLGYINELLPDLGLNWENTSAIICASPKRIKAVSKDLLSLGMKGKDIYTSLETHMRCGIGKCGHCKVGNKYMCIDGPVFNYDEMLALPPEF